WVMPPLILATLVLWFSIGYRFAALKRGSERDVRNLIRRYEKGKVPKKQGVLVRALEKGMTLRERSVDNLRAYLDDAFFEEEKDTRRYNRLIMTIVSAAPLLGLLGTVIGMIETFDSLGDMSLFSQSGGIAGGISQALITTQMGLAVAIPGLIVNGILSRRQKDIEIELAQLKDLLVAGSIEHERP
ncbi:MAG: MotA/TolQ/ExbB proton channel family protein, partial [Lysobacterales bacterium]